MGRAPGSLARGSLARRNFFRFRGRLPGDIPVGKTDV